MADSERGSRPAAARPRPCTRCRGRPGAGTCRERAGRACPAPDRRRSPRPRRSASACSRCRICTVTPWIHIKSIWSGQGGGQTTQGARRWPDTDRCAPHVANARLASMPVRSRATHCSAAARGVALAGVAAVRAIDRQEGCATHPRRRRDPPAPPWWPGCHAGSCTWPESCPMLDIWRNCEHGRRKHQQGRHSHPETRDNRSRRSAGRMLGGRPWPAPSAPKLALFRC